MTQKWSAHQSRQTIQLKNNKEFVSINPHCPFFQLIQVGDETLEGMGILLHAALVVILCCCRFHKGPFQQLSLLEKKNRVGWANLLILNLRLPKSITYQDVSWSKEYSHRNGLVPCQTVAWMCLVAYHSNLCTQWQCYTHFSCIKLCLVLQDAQPVMADLFWITCMKCCLMVQELGLWLLHYWTRQHKQIWVFMIIAGKQPRSPTTVQTVFLLVFNGVVVVWKRH